MNTNTIAVIAFDGISPFHLSVPCAVFGRDRTGADMPEFKLMVCSAEEESLQTPAGFSIETRHDLRNLSRAEMIIVPSWRDTAEMPPAALLNALRRAHKRGALIVGLCLGSFVLAAAGLLDGRAATTHWHWADELASRYPLVQVNRDVLYVDDGDIITSAGTAAAIDCCLHIVRKRHGSAIANHIARRMVVSPHRQGGQAQYIKLPVRDISSNDHFSNMLEWIGKNLDQPHSLDTLAERAVMTRRTFTRRFKQTMGMTVNEWLLNQRLNLAQQLLEATESTLKLIAERSGFASPALLRLHFQRTFKISPTGYRREFRGV